MEELVVSVASIKTAPGKTEPDEALDLLGPRIQILTALSNDDDLRVAAQHVAIHPRHYVTAGTAVLARISRIS